eukprot:4128669-Prymnesium_polylepis.1
MCIRDRASGAACPPPPPCRPPPPLPGRWPHMGHASRRRHGDKAEPGDRVFSCPEPERASRVSPLSLLASFRRSV